MFRDREAFLTGVRHFVPGMQFCSELVHGQPTAFSLGTPAAADNDIIDNDIDADAVAGTVTAQDWTADSPYGRTLTMNMNADPGAAGGVYDVRGWDYLGQRMVERFTHANGSTAVIYGKKAFYRVDQVVVVTAATNATTVDLGTGFRLGLPYRGDIAWVKENGILVPLYKTPFTLGTVLSDADTTSGGSVYLRSPAPGYITTLRAIPGSGGSTTNAASTVELGGTAIVGLTVTADQDAPGTAVTDVPTTEGYNANNRFRTGDLIELIHAATTAGGIMTLEVDIQPVQFIAPTDTDPATAITGDPRGTYEAHLTYDGAKEIIVGLLGDNSLNASNNGGLHGIAHYYA